MFKLADIVPLFLCATILYIFANSQFEFLALSTYLTLIAELRIGSSYNQLIFIKFSYRLERLLHSYRQYLSLIALSHIALRILLGIYARG